MPFTTLANELILSIADYLPLPALNSLSQANHHLNALLTSPLLNRIDITNASFAANSSAKNGREDILKLALSVPGFSPGHDNRRCVYVFRLCGALVQAAANGYETIVGLLLAYPWSPTHPSEAFRLWRSLRAAAENGHLGVVVQLLDAGADVNGQLHRLTVSCCFQAVHKYLNGRWRERTSTLHSPLAAASGSGHTKVVEALLKRGAAVDNLSAEFGERPLYVAARKGNVETVKVLLDAGAYVNAGEGAALHAAVKGGYRDVVEVLVANGADMTMPNSEGKTPLDFATSQDLRSLLCPTEPSTERQKPQFLNLPNELILSIAAELPLKDLSYLSRASHHLNNLLQASVDKEFAQDAPSIFYWAAKQGREYTLSRAIATGIRVGESEDGKSTYTGVRSALHLAAGGGHSGAVKILLKHVPFIYFLHAPLLAAVKNQDVDVIQQLLDAGALVGFWWLRLELGTAMHHACVDGNEVIVRMLLGRPQWMTGLRQLGTLKIALRNGHRGVAKLLIENGINVRRRDENGSTLQLACENGDEEMVEILQARGAKVDIPGFVTLRVAVENGHWGVVRLLVGNDERVREEYDRIVKEVSGLGWTIKDTVQLVHERDAGDVSAKSGLVKERWHRLWEKVTRNLGKELS